MNRPLREQEQPQRAASRGKAKGSGRDTNLEKSLHSSRRTQTSKGPSNLLKPSQGVQQQNRHQAPKDVGSETPKRRHHSEQNQQTNSGRKSLHHTIKQQSRGRLKST